MSVFITVKNLKQTEKMFCEISTNVRSDTKEKNGLQLRLLKSDIVINVLG